MASRPLPPGRRGRGPRVASGLHNLPEVKLLDVPETPTSVHAAPVSVRSAAVEPQATASAEIEKSTTTRSFKAAAMPRHTAVEPQSSVAKAPVVGATPPYAAPAVVAAPVKPVVAEQPAAVVKPEPHRVEHAPPAYQHRSLHVPTAVAPPVSMRSSSIKAPAVTPTPVAKPFPSPPAAAPAVTAPALASAPAPQNESVDLGEFHPFYLLLPVDAVPQVPESIECIYDEVAVEMQKNVLKVVRKLLGRDKMKLEDFKINSRLFGNSFMEPYEYLESLVEDFGGVRTLQLVPCLLVIQADFMRRSGLLLAARNYRMRHLAALEAECQALRAVEAAPVPAPVPAPQSVAPSSQSLPVAAVVDAVEEAVVSNDEPQEEEEKFVEETVVPDSLPAVVAPEQKAELGLFAALVDSGAVATIAEVAHSAEKPREDDVLDASTVAAASSSDVTSASPNHHAVEEVYETPVSQAEEVSSSETNVWTEPHVEIESDAVQPVDDLKPIQKSVEPLVEVVQSPAAIEPEAPEPTETKRAKADEVSHTRAHSSRADDECDVDMLPAAFRHAFASYDSEPVAAKPVGVVPVAETSSSSKTHKVDIEPTSVSSTLSNRSSFAEAESLFGERMSTGSTSSDNAENLFGESLFQPATTPTPASVSTDDTEPASAAAPASFAAPKREHSQLLFGFATAGADTDSDSDSDDSGFNSN